MNRFHIVIASACLLSSAGAAVGQTGTKPAAAPPPSAPAAPAQAGAVPIPRTQFIEVMDAEFRKIDADKNGIVTKKEIEDFQRAVSVLANQQRLVALFQGLDADKNGQLSPAEFAALRLPSQPPNAGPVLAQTDGNHDGQVTLVEYRAGKLANFDRMDSDKDGIVSIAEMKAAGLIR
ncbi:MAG TPA: EF-hand domain-containing protein [Sphingomicrobium sp.]